jgi:hypothetical protein
VNAQEVSDARGLDLHAVMSFLMWVLGIELGSLPRVAHKAEPSL